MLMSVERVQRAGLLAITCLTLLGTLTILTNQELTSTTQPVKQGTTAATLHNQQKHHSKNWNSTQREDSRFNSTEHIYIDFGRAEHSNVKNESNVMPVQLQEHDQVELKTYQDSKKTDHELEDTVNNIISHNVDHELKDTVNNIISHNVDHELKDTVNNILSHNVDHIQQEPKKESDDETNSMLRADTSDTGPSHQPLKDWKFRRRKLEDWRSDRLRLPAPSPSSESIIQLETSICYKGGTKEGPSRKAGVCICRRDYYGSDCGIPGSVQYNKDQLVLNVTMRPVSRRIVQLLIVNHELDFIEMRMKQNGNAVDGYIILESRYSAYGEEKEEQLFRKLQAGWLAAYQHKILYIYLDFFPDQAKADGWYADSYPRTYLGEEGLQRWTIYGYFWRPVPAGGQEQLTVTAAAATFSLVKAVFANNVWALRANQIQNEPYSSNLNKSGLEVEYCGGPLGLGENPRLYM